MANPNPDPHIVALETLLAATGKTVYTGRAPSSALTALGNGSGLGYIVLEPSQGLASTTSYEGSSDQRRVRAVTRYFARSWQEVDALRTNVKLVFLDVRPSVTGRSSERIEHETEFPFDRDEDMPEAVMWSGDSWIFATWPA